MHNQQALEVILIEEFVKEQFTTNGVENTTLVNDGPDSVIQKNSYQQGFWLPIKIYCHIDDNVPTLPPILGIDPIKNPVDGSQLNLQNWIKDKVRKYIESQCKSGLK